VKLVAPDEHALEAVALAASRAAHDEQYLLATMDVAVIAALGSALSDVTRARVLGLSDGARSVSEIAATLNVTTSDVRYHLRRLADVGMVDLVRLGHGLRPRRRAEAVSALLRALAAPVVINVESLDPAPSGPPSMAPEAAHAPTEAR
jgi:DNA-binding transcriptional ArsR family regulator